MNKLIIAQIYNMKAILLIQINRHNKQQILSMNVVRQLRNTITHLQAQIQKKQKQLKRQQKDYQQIIQSLQSQNQKLRQLLQNDSLSQNREQLFAYKDQQYEKNNISTNKKVQDVYLSMSQYTELINENTFLKNQISELSTTYQKQIDQLTYYFQKIKQQNQRISPAHYAGQMKLISNWTQSCLKDFETERQKYIRKLQQCAQTLQLYQNKIFEQNQQIEQLKLDIKQSQEKMKIVARVIF